ncbi:AMP-binding protein [Halopseudomonas pachastrellae]|nr:AMP-binding protein [Halopseudomonas pachastrellae]
MHEQDYLDTLKAIQAKVWPAGKPTTPVYPQGERPLTEYLAHWAHTAPERVAVHFYGHQLTYAELDDQSNRCAALLQAQGIKPGDRVAVFMPNCPQLHIAFYGILKMGAIHAPVSPMAKGMELSYQLNDCGARAIICFDQLLPVVQEVREQTALEQVSPPACLNSAQPSRRSRCRICCKHPSYPSLTAST